MAGDSDTVRKEGTINDATSSNNYANDTIEAAASQQPPNLIITNHRNVEE